MPYFCLSYRPAENIFVRAETQDRFFVVVSFVPVTLPCSEINSFGLGTILLSFLISDSKKMSLPGLEHRKFFGAVLFVP